MKKSTITLSTLLLVMLFINSANAQVSNKEMRSKLKFKPVSEVKKDAKDYAKQGYYVAVGAPSIERQLTNGLLKEQETDEQGFSKYIVATGRAVGETQIAAKLQATESAKLELAGTMASNIAALMEGNYANAQLNQEEAASVTKIVAASKNVIAQEIGRIITLVEMYKDINKNIEANVRIAYNSDMAMEAAKKVIRTKLEDESKGLQDKLDKLMKF
ncbi:MAG: hypothetical protein JZU47_10250 [Prolixibacteraceae bacterium]|nr:hypothetical protein [Prolixibacteraceae bacterium]MBV5313667.1 hypothetical protein [Prolixibacteraceae bacterium]